MKRQTHPTYTGLVFEYLTKLDDFASVPTIALNTGLKAHQVNTTLVCLKGYKAVDCTDVHGALWWCASPDTDTRTKTIKEIAVHSRKVTKRGASARMKKEEPK